MVETGRRAETVRRETGLPGATVRRETGRRAETVRRETGHRAETVRRETGRLGVPGPRVSASREAMARARVRGASRAPGRCVPRETVRLEMSRRAQTGRLGVTGPRVSASRRETVHGGSASLSAMVKASVSGESRARGPRSSSRGRRARGGVLRSGGASGPIGGHVSLGAVAVVRRCPT